MHRKSDTGLEYYPRADSLELEGHLEVGLAIQLLEPVNVGVHLSRYLAVWGPISLVFLTYLLHNLPY